MAALSLTRIVAVRRKRAGYEYSQHENRALVAGGLRPDVAYWSAMLS